MNIRKKATEAANPLPTEAKVRDEKDIDKVFEFFRYTTVYAGNRDSQELNHLLRARP